MGRIIYNPLFIRELISNSGTDWAGIGVLAHEVGHVLLSHFASGEYSELPREVNHRKELQADAFAARVLYKMGASLSETQSFVKNLRGEIASHSHPAKRTRVVAVTAAWDDMKARKEVIEPLRGSGNNRDTGELTEEPVSSPPKRSTEKPVSKRDNDRWIDEEPVSIPSRRTTEEPVNNRDNDGWIDEEPVSIPSRRTTEDPIEHPSLRETSETAYIRKYVTWAGYDVEHDADFPSTSGFTTITRTIHNNGGYMIRAQIVARLRPFNCTTYEHDTYNDIWIKSAPLLIQPFSSREVQAIGFFSVPEGRTCLEDKTFSKALTELTNNNEFFVNMKAELFEKWFHSQLRDMGYDPEYSLLFLVD